MVYVALSVVALSISFYIVSYGRPSTFLSYRWRKPEKALRGLDDGTGKPRKSGGEMDEDIRDAGGQLRSELQDTQDNADRSKNESPQTTPKALPQNAQSQRPIPSFSLDGASDDPPRPAGRLRIDRSHQQPILSSPRSPQRARDQPLTPTASMPPPPRPSPTARRKPDTPTSPRATPNPQTTSTPSSSLMPPPSRPTRPSPSSTLLPPPSAASLLRKPPTSSLAPTSSSLPVSSRPSKKVLLAPGHSPLDWAALVAAPPTPTFLRGSSVPTQLIKIPPSLLKYHNGRKDPKTGKMKDAWGVWAGRVYNMTPYLDFHPGGRGEILRGAGRGEREMRRLFEEVHPWVSWEGMLGGCLVGILVGEGDERGEAGGEGGMDEMD